MLKSGIGAAIVAAAMSFALISTANAAPPAASITIDFEAGFSAGDTVTELSKNNGFSATGNPGTIAVSVDSSNPGTTDGMIFDAACDGGPAANCSGGDSDLFQPANGNVLIATANGDAGDPNDAVGSIMEFDFSDFRNGIVSVESIDLLDSEEGGTIQLYNGGAAGILLATVPLPTPGDGSIATVSIDQGLVDFMRINLTGSGAVDNLVLGEDTREWMTGGGNITEGRGRNAELFSTHGFIIRCDASFARFQYNDHLNGGNFHLESVDTVECTDAGGINPHPPAADFDTLTMTGTGRWNGVSGATVVVTMTDTGQPARADVLDIVVTDKDGVVVSDRDGTLTVGNHQAH